MENLAKAVIKVVQAVKGIDKSLTVGSGNSSYKGVSDQDVKKIIGDAMAKNGLCILPIAVTPKVQVERWEEEVWDNYQKKNVTKQKQSVFTEVQTKYLLLHESGESVELEGYGHGVDTQDKSAGKATTYALKYALLYSFLVPTGKIDDTDNEHSDHYNTAPSQAELDRIEKERITQFKESVQAAIVVVKNTKSIDELKSLKMVYSQDIRNTKEYQDAATAQAESFNKAPEPTEESKSEENIEGLKKKKVEKPKKETPQERLETIQEEKPADNFIDEMNNMKASLNEGTVGLFNEDGNFDEEFKPEEPELVEAEEVIDVLQAAITHGKSFTDPAAMVTWWKSEQDNLGIALTKEEFDLLKKEFSSHYEKIKA